MIDTHSHLWFKHFDKDRDKVIQRARKAGVHTMIQVGCDQQSSRQSVQLAEEHGGMYATVGLHPNDHRSWEDGQALEWMWKLLKSSDKVVAIGETGIDYYRSSDQAKLQQEMLKGQCELAKEQDLPVIIHLRSTQHSKPVSDELSQAEVDCLRVLDEVQMTSGKVVFHCFAGDRTMAQEVLDRGWILSFSGVLTYPKSDELREVVKMAPLESILVETDCPFLPPQKYRGQRNEPAYVRETALVVAQERGVGLEEVERQTDENARRIFLFS